MADRPHHRPLRRSNEFFAEVDAGGDPALAREAGDLAATLLVRGVADDPALAERVVRLAEDEGLEVLAEVWSGAPADTLAGCLWRLYLLREWVHANPHRAAEEFQAGRGDVRVTTVLAGVADPPGPDELRAMTDAVLRGIADGDFAVTLFRAAAFARIVAAGRAHLARPELPDALKMLAVADQLEQAAHAELRGILT